MSGFSISNPRYRKLLVLTGLLKCIKERYPEDCVIVASQSTVTLDFIGRHLSSNGIGPLSRIDGDTKNRQRILDNFNGYVLLISARVCGVGLNLTKANRIIIYEPSWNPAVDDQTAARVWRTGQFKQVYIYRLALQGCLDERIIQRQLHKIQLSTLVGDQYCFSNSMNRDELRRLVELELGCPSTTHQILNCTKCTDTLINEIPINNPSLDNIEQWLHTVPENLSKIKNIEELCLDNTENMLSFVFLNQLC
ncbi:hypothetical protein GJ496_001539 [Pomphorhynchus laevis]|nr:hypothetical protein GJ496_001539 [Pomphorhynchus laevis]